MKKRAISLFIAISIVLSLAVGLQPVAAAASLSDMSAEIRSRYGFNASFRQTAAIEETLWFLYDFPEAMLKEMTNTYRNRGMTPSIVQGEARSGSGPYIGDYIAGITTIERRSVEIKLYHAYALAHEIGHALDYHLGYRLGRITASSALVSLNAGWNYGGWYNPSVFASEYGATSHYEDFAEIIDHLFSSPQRVRAYMLKNPNTQLTKKYNYVMDLIVNNFKSCDSLGSTFPLVYGVSVILDGRLLMFDVSPQVKNGRVLVPLRVIFNELGASVNWNGPTQTITATRGGTVIVMKIGSNSPTVNGAVVPIDQPGIVVDGRTLVPVRFVSEALGVSVLWDGTTRTVTIAS